MKEVSGLRRIISGWMTKSLTCRAGILAVATTLLAGCDPGAGTTDRQTAAPSRTLDSVADVSASTSRFPDRETFVTDGLLLPGRTRAELASALGAADSVQSEVVPNRHVPGAQDTLFTIFYPGLVVGIHRPGPGGELLSSAEVWSNRYLRYPAIGARRSSILAAFGPPDRMATDSLTYRCTSCIAGDDPVTLVFVEDRVERVGFSFYVD